MPDCIWVDISMPYQASDSLPRTHASVTQALSSALLPPKRVCSTLSTLPHHPLGVCMSTAPDAGCNSMLSACPCLSLRHPAAQLSKHLWLQNQLAQVLHQTLKDPLVPDSVRVVDKLQSTTVTPALVLTANELAVSCSQQWCWQSWWAAAWKSASNQYQLSNCCQRCQWQCVRAQLDNCWQARCIRMLACGCQ